jgi:lysophospholipase L1-like esterase
MHRIISGLAFSLLSLEAGAFRTALFDPSLQNRAVFWQNQKRLLDQPGVLWLHAGDSLASGWATRSTLRERFEEAAKGELPTPGTLADLQSHIPSAKYTWYAGTEIGLGFLGFLDKLLPQGVSVVSTALAGATITVKGREDALGLLLQIDETQRVELVTLSLGSNDACQGLDPTTDGTLRSKLRLVRSHMPARTHWLVWDVIDVPAVYQAAMERIDTLPDSLAKERLRAYCDASWSLVNCPAAKDDPTKAREIRERIRSIYREVFGDLVEPTPVFANRDPLDVMSADCFHPSRLSQPIIAEMMRDAYVTRTSTGK